MTTRNTYDVTFEVAVKSPFIMAGVEAVAVGVDTPALRNEDRDPILPGDHLKGLLRQAFAVLNAANIGFAVDIDILLGAEPKGDLEPARGCLLLRDLVAQNMSVPERNAPESIRAWHDEAIKPGYDRAGAEITRIAIDAETGSVKTGALQVVELAAPIGAVALFRGKATFYGTDEESEDIEQKLQRALKLIPYFGGLRTIGFGEHVAEASTVTCELRTPAKSAWPDDRPMVEMTACFDSAFMVDVSQPADNVYVGGTVVPGAAIKGALADMLAKSLEFGDPKNAGTVLAQAVSAVHISHAQPLVGGLEADMPLPLSIMRAPGKDHHFECAFAATAPGLIDGRCADFQPDWKYPYTETARQKAARPASRIRSLPRGHTKITSETGIAEDQKLFVEVLRAARSDGKPQEFCFCVDTNTVPAETPEEKKALDEIRRILSTGLDAVGKTNARFTVTSAQPIEPTSPDQAGEWRILLETPAVLIAPDDVDGNPFDDTAAALRTYFGREAPDAELIDWYAQRSIIGGYASRRHDRGVADYAPVLMFRAGSCFRLRARKGKSAEVVKDLARLVRQGLPVYRNGPVGLLTKVTNWRECRYLPENGYGRISVNAAVFKELHGYEVTA